MSLLFVGFLTTLLPKTVKFNFDLLTSWVVRENEFYLPSLPHLLSFLSALCPGSHATRLSSIAINGSAEPGEIVLIPRIFDGARISVAFSWVIVMPLLLMVSSTDVLQIF